jgi:FkbM family methyltransferase
MIQFKYNNTTEWSLDGPPDDHITHVLQHSYYEGDLLETIYNRYGLGGVFYDFGAFIGTHSLFFAAVCKADLVVAIEANPDSYKWLRKNIEANPLFNIESLNVAVGNTKGRSCLLPGTDQGGTNWIETGGIADTVPRLISGDLITAPPKFIKIDCESSTPDVLRGLLDVINQHRPIIAVEFGYGTDDITPILQPLGYRLVGTFCATPTGIWEPAEYEGERK